MILLRIYCNSFYRQFTVHHDGIPSANRMQELIGQVNYLDRGEFHHLLFYSNLFYCERVVLKVI